MRNIGIMQGRLTKPLGRGIQFFPFQEWKCEFEIAKRIGIDEIEWIFDYPDYQKNPLWTKEGTKEICAMIQTSGVQVNAVCWDYFMRRPFYKNTESTSESVLVENKEMMQRTLEAMGEIGASLVEIPMVDDSSVKNAMEANAAIEFIRWACEMASQYNIMVGLETDFSPKWFCKFLNSIKRSNVVANYDSGNSSGLGYDHRDELLNLGAFVYNVHIKDRVKGNGTVRLGTGSADFDKVFGTLKEIGYKNSFILQAARGEDGSEEDTIREQICFISEYMSKYGLE